ncbi:hypothetical protein CQA53_02365 [Helicobacter didelphidarum]|uniref:Outer membrane beta-barrel protein n=1 Tax=Helicobacter didelphidarum TaxID=2040648 RepID=A0A3D8IP94_9HELI|nr:hypothetical protein [Helicobacter didelphidarum]RDU67117.1 hypothetical protein CQA53_02365 [Helicobacter didelphidarum]
MSILSRWFVSFFFFIVLLPTILFAQDIQQDTSASIPSSIDSKIESGNSNNQASNITKLELAGEDSFGYDVSNKIRKTKSNFHVGIGMNMVYDSNLSKVQFNASIIVGYSYFFHKTFGLRGYGIFDNKYNSFYGAFGIDVIWDFLQTEPFGMGIILGSSIGYSQGYKTQGDGFLGQAHAGISFIFDAGRSRIEGIVRIPYNDVPSLPNFTKVGITYIIMYSYTF